MSDAVLVEAPIRYGRRSSSRHCTFTMVFSNECVEGGHPTGAGLAVPAADKVQTAKDLVAEATHLWVAEGGKAQIGKSIVSGTWGSVGLLPNPDATMPEDFMDHWAETVQASPSYGRLDRAEDEAPLIDSSSGIVDIPWPRALEDSQPLDLDALLLTATNPEIIRGRYADPQSVADAWNLHADEVHYFHENRQLGITTVHDEEIASRLERGCD